MCGIAGILNDPSELTIRKMVSTIAHRGPDGWDCAVIRNHAAGGSRLAIVGDPGASVVFRDLETGLITLLNGEIYNTEQLRREMEAAGVVFSGDLEAEVVAKLYAAQGIEFVGRLKGMFAIAILDGDRLVLARDRFGIKPLYYSQIGDKVIFGSEIKAVLAHPDARAALDIDSLEAIAVFGYIYSPDATPFDGIRQVEPGSVMTFDDDGVRTIRFSDMPLARYANPNEEHDYDLAMKLVRQHVIDAVRILIQHGDQPKGLYLSGGLDSTIVAVVARRILGYPLTTFTLADSPDNADFLAARRVARQLGTQHVERVVSAGDYLSALEDFVYHYESPVAGGVFDLHGAIAFHLLSETVAQHVKVAFSGEGADELFGGYYWIYTHPLGFSDRIRSRLERFASRARVRQQVDDLFPSPEDEILYRRNLLSALLKSGLSNYHLQSVDRSCGAYGFEVRPVYLYDDLASLALSLPIEYKVPDKTTTKRILRDAFRSELERLGLGWVLTRLKEGMPAALANIGPSVRQVMEESIARETYARHPLRSFFESKMELYLYELFARTFHLQESRNEPSHALQHCHPQ